MLLSRDGQAVIYQMFQITREVTTHLVSDVNWSLKMFSTVNKLTMVGSS